MSNQEQFDEEEDGPAVLSSWLPESFCTKLGLEKLESIMNNKSAPYTTKVESLIQVWQQVSQCPLDEENGDYVVRLMDWLKRHTLNIVLNGDWSITKAYLYEAKLLNEINNCELFLANANSVYSLRCRKLAEVIKDPWGNSSLKSILSDTNITIGPEVFEFFRMETGHLISTRLKQLCESHCEDLALNLVTVFIKCHQLSERENFSLNANLNQIRYCFDIYISLLFKFKRYEDINTTLRSMSLVEGLELLTRFANKRVNALKIWKHSKQIAYFVGTEYVREIVSKPPEDSVNLLQAFLDIWLSVTNISNERLVAMFKNTIRKIILTAESAVLLYTFSEMVFKKFGQEMKTFVIELYIRALTTDMNILERQKNENETAKITETSERLATGFLSLSDVVEEHVKLSRECVLTSFSLVPTRQSFDRLITSAVRSGCESVDSWKCKYHPPADLSDEVLWPCKECGEYISEVKKIPVNINTALSEALTEEELGLSPQLCDDLAVLLSCSRYQFLNWLVPWRDLYRLCVLYLDDAEGTRNFVKDLKFVEIDYTELRRIKCEPKEEDVPIYDPYFEDYLNLEDPVSDSQELHSNIESGIPLLQPYCSKSNPEVLKRLRQFRPNLKRTKTPALENEPPEKVYLPSSSTTSSAGSNSSTTNDENFFTPFYYFVNDYNKINSLVPNATLCDTPVRNSDSNFPQCSSNMFQIEPINYSFTSQRSADKFKPLENSSECKDIIYHSQQIKSNCNEPKKSSSNDNFKPPKRIEKTINNSKLMVAHKNVIKHASVTKPTAECTIAISSNCDSFKSSPKNDKLLGFRINSNRAMNSNAIENVETEHQCCLDETNYKHLNSIINISDTKSIDSDIGIVDPLTSVRSNLNIRSEFYRKVPFGKEVVPKTEKLETDSVCKTKQEIISHTKQNFHIEGKNTDSPENQIADAEENLKIPNALEKAEVFSASIVKEEPNDSFLTVPDGDDEMDATVIETNVSSTNGNCLNNVSVDSSTDSDKLLNFSENGIASTSIYNTTNIFDTSKLREILKLTMPPVTNHDKSILQSTNQKSGCIIDSDTDIVIENTFNKSSHYLEILQFAQRVLCGCCKEKLETIKNNPGNHDTVETKVIHTCENNGVEIPSDYTGCKPDIKLECLEESDNIHINIPIQETSVTGNFEKCYGNNYSQIITSRSPSPETNVSAENDKDQSGVSDFENINNLQRKRLDINCDSSCASRPKKKKLTGLKKKYGIRQVSVVLHKSNERKMRKRKFSNLHNTCSTCISYKNPEMNMKAKSENKAKDKVEKELMVVKVNIVTKPNKTSPLQDVNPKVYSRKVQNLKKCESVVKQEKRDSEAVDKLEIDQDKQENSNSPFSNVPGLNDLQMIKPSSVDRIVQVVQVPGNRCSASVPVQPNMTQISPHIQRIGQPRFEKLECTNLTNSVSTTNSTASTTPTLINLLPQQVPRPVGNSRIRKNLPTINTLSQAIKPANSTSINIHVPTSGSTAEGQVNSVPCVITGGEQILNQLINPDGTSTQALRTLVGSAGSDQNRIVQLICKSSDGKLIPVTSFTSNKVVKLSMTQTVNSQVTGNATGSEENVTKFSQTTTKIKAELMENSEILPKFQQAFGKPAYQNCVNVTECITVNNSERDVSTDLGKSNVIKTQPKSLNAAINVQPVQGGVIYARQVPVAQSINIIPPTRGQILRIATSSTEELSLVKETVIQGKMTALLAAALQGNKQKSSNSNEININSEEYSQTSTHVALTTCPALVQNARIVKPIIQIPSNIIRNSPQCNLSSTTLEQLREFDMVYKQVKERSNTGVASDSNTQSDSNEETQHVSVTYLNQGQKINCAPVVVVSNYCNVQPASSPSLSITSQGSSSPCVTPAPTPINIISKVPVKTKAKVIKSPIAAQMAKSPPIAKPQQKPQEDEHTTQRIFDILAEYAEQLRNSPDLNNKPAPRRRSNPPTNPNQNSKRKKSSGSKRLEQCNTIDIDLEDAQTVGSEDSSCGVIQLSVPDDEQPSVELSETSILPKQIILTDNVANQHHNLIITDSSVGEALKVSGTAVLVPGNYIMPVSMMKGSQQIVVSGGSKILATVPARSGPNMLLFQSFLNQTHTPVLSAVKCSGIQPVVDVSQSLSPTSNQISNVNSSSQNIASVTLAQRVPRNSATIDVNSDREVFLNIPDPVENKKTNVHQFEQIRKVYHNNFHHTKTELKEDVSLYKDKVINDTDVKRESLSALEAAVNSTGTTNTNTAVIINSLASTTPIKTTAAAANTSVATSVITHIKDEINGLREAEHKSEIAQRILNSADFIKDTKVQVEGRVKSVLVTTGTANGFTFPHIASTPCNKQAESSNSGSHLNKDICDGGKLKSNKPVIHTYRGRTKKNHNGCKLTPENIQLQQFKKRSKPYKDLQCKQVIIQKDLHLQKSLSEECADLGVDEPSPTELFPEADFMYDSTNQFDQSSVPVRRLSQSKEPKDELKEVGLFCDDEPARTDPLFDTFEYHTQIFEYRLEGVINGQHHNKTAEEAVVDNTLLQTSLSADEVTIPDPCEGNTSPSSLYKYRHTNTKYKKNRSGMQFKEKLTNALRKNFSSRTSSVLEFAETTKTLNTNQSLDICEQL